LTYKSNVTISINCHEYKHILTLRFSKDTNNILSEL